MMTSDFELKTLAKLIHDETIDKAERRRVARSVKKSRHVTSNEYRGFVIREVEPCQN